MVFADFVCPYSYLAVDQIDRLAREYDVKPLWRPHWLHPETPPEGTPREQTPESAAKRERLHAWMKEMAPEQYPRIRFPERRQLQLPRVRGARIRLRPEPRSRVQDGGLRRHVDQAGDIGKPETLMAAAERSGLDPDELGEALDDRSYAQRALDACNQAREIGITNTPTIFLGRTRINGWHYYEVLQSVMEKQGMRPREAAIAG